MEEKQKLPEITPGLIQLLKARDYTITFAGKLGVPLNGFIKYSKSLKRNKSTIRWNKKCINLLLTRYLRPLQRLHRGLKHGPLFC
jgi:hypothetical protein